MADECDDWMSGLGVDVRALRKAASDAASSAVQAVADTASTVAEAVTGDAPPAPAQVASAAVADVAQSNITAAPALAAAAPVPASPAEPGLLEEVEDAAVSTVRVIARAAPEIEEVGVAAAVVAAAPAIAVGVLAGAVVLTWASDAGAKWDGATNPETGKPFTSQEEYDRYRASQRDKQSTTNTQTLDRHDEERYAEGILNDGTSDCDALIEAIKGLIKALRERHDAMGESGGGDPGHVQRYEAVQELLKKLIARAKANECAIDTSEAEEWSTYPAH
jgi:hypothetical protein